MEIWFAKNNERLGPFSEEQAQHMIESGQIAPGDLFWKQGMEEWAPVGTDSSRNPNLPPPTTYPPQHATQETLQGPVYAGFWIRFLASFIDGLVTGFAGFVVGFVVGFTFKLTGASDTAAKVFAQLLGMLGSWLYEALMLSSSKQATLGKLALGIRVTDEDGQTITFARASGRFFAKYISAIILLIGFIMAAFTSRKQALHDIIASTLVTRTPRW